MEAHQVVHNTVAYVLSATALAHDNKILDSRSPIHHRSVLLMAESKKQKKNKRLTNVQKYLLHMQI